MPIPVARAHPLCNDGFTSFSPGVAVRHKILCAVAVLLPAALPAQSVITTAGAAPHFDDNAWPIAEAARSFSQEDDITVLTLTFAPAEVLHA